MRRGCLEGLTGRAVGLHKKKGIGQRRRQYGKHTGGYAVQLPHIRQRTPGSHNTRRGAQRIVDGGGAVASEQPWDRKPRPYMFRQRNRLIAGLARAVLIVEAGLPSGTFSTADEALAANRDVLVVPGAITAASSRGANRLLYQGALPIVDDEAFADALFSTFGCLKEQRAEAADDRGKASQPYRGEEALLAALQAEPLGMEALRQLAEDHAPAGDTFTWLMIWLAEAQRDGLIAQYPDGRYGPHPALRTAV